MHSPIRNPAFCCPYCGVPLPTDQRESTPIAAPAGPPPQELASGFGRLPRSVAGSGYGHFAQYPSVLDDLFD
jgi:hypothetical protein